jgi:hypothetical protein
MTDRQRTELVVDESDLYEVYTLLADATEAAATGDPNGCAALASDAKEKVKTIHAESEVVGDD